MTFSDEVIFLRVQRWVLGRWEQMVAVESLRRTARTMVKVKLRAKEAMFLNFISQPPDPQVVGAISLVHEIPSERVVETYHATLRHHMYVKRERTQVLM